MKFIETKLKGAFIIQPEFFEDERGLFGRTFCQKEFLEHGLHPNFVQCNFSYNKRKGILRGMHYQVAPHQEAKLAACIKGAIYDVMIDLRPESPSYRQWTSVTLSPHGAMLYIPEGVAHGFQTLEDDSEVFYHMSEFYHPESARRVRWDDPLYDVAWPIPDPILSEKDRGNG